MPEIRWQDFRGGLHLPNVSEAGEQADFALPENALLKADNIEFSSAGALRGRRGRRLFGSALAGEVVGLHRHYPRERTLVGPTEHGTTAVTLNELGGLFAGGSVWFNPQGALEFTETEASTSPEFIDGQQGLFSQWLVVGGYFNAGDVPANSPIVGVSVTVRRRATAGLIRDLQVRVGHGVDFKGNNKAATKVNWPEDFAGVTYGGPADLWGTTWSSTEFDNEFFVALRVRGLFGEGGAPSCEVDAVDVAVWYLSAEGVFTVAPKLIAARNESGHRRFSSCADPATDLTPSWFTHDIGQAGDPVELDEADMPRFVSWPEKSKTFIFDGVNAPLFFDGEDFAPIEQTGDLAPRKGPYATLWRNRLWATDPAEGDFSVYATVIQEEGNWPAYAQLSLNDPKGGKIVGLAGMGDALVALKETSLWAFQGDIQFGGQLVRYADHGCVAPDSVAMTPSGIIYLARDGVYLTDGSSPAPVELSGPIRDLFVGRLVATVYPEAVGIYFPRRQQYWLRLSPDATETWVMHRIEAGGERSLAWSRIPSLSWLSACTFDGETEAGDIFLGGADGYVRQADYGTQDEGANYSVDVVTASKPLGALQLGRAYHAKPTYRGAAAVTLGLRYDHDESDTLSLSGGSTLASPTVQSPRITITNQGTFGRFVAVRVASTEGPHFELHHVSLDTMLKSGKRWP